MGDEDTKLMDMLGDTDQIELFRTKVIEDLIHFKWYSYARNIHFLFATIHMLYTFTFCAYVNETYLLHNKEHRKQLLAILTVCLLCAMMYDFRQMFKQGMDYFLDYWNYLDQLYIWSGFIMIYFQHDFYGITDVRSH